jgi:hypothetical protein
MNTSYKKLFFLIIPSPKYESLKIQRPIIVYKIRDNPVKQNDFDIQFIIMRSLNLICFIRFRYSVFFPKFADLKIPNNS